MYFCGCVAKIKIMTEYNKIESWVEDLPKRGKSIFSKQEIVKQFSDMSYYSVRNALNRLVNKKKIQSVWHNFYTISLPEYGLNGIAPPIEYIDQLMKYLGKNYYVALLNAAEIHGAAHQAPQEFFIITNTTKLRDKHKKDIKINFVAKKIIPQKHLTQVMTNSSYVNVSSPILTAYDLVCYAKSVGEINRVATIINELAEKIRFTNIDKEFMQSFSPAVTQRLGYLFDELKFEELANKLYHKAEIAGLKFRKTPLVIVNKTKDLSKYDINEKWKIIINEQIDIDE